VNKMSGDDIREQIKEMYREIISENLGLNKLLEQDAPPGREIDRNQAVMNEKIQEYYEGILDDQNEFYDNVMMYVYENGEQMGLDKYPEFPEDGSDLNKLSTFESRMRQSLKSAGKKKLQGLAGQIQNLTLRVATAMANQDLQEVLK